MRTNVPTTKYQLASLHYQQYSLLQANTILKGHINSVTVSVLSQADNKLSSCYHLSHLNVLIINWAGPGPLNLCLFSLNREFCESQETRGGKNREKFVYHQILQRLRGTTVVCSWVSCQSVSQSVSSTCLYVSMSLVSPSLSLSP